MTGAEVAAWLGVGLAALSAAFAGLAWDAARPRARWKLSAATGGVAVLTRNGLRRAHLTRVWVPHRKMLLSTDDRAELEGRRLRRHDWLQLAVEDCQPGDVVVVSWKTRGRKKEQHEPHPLVFS